MEMSEQKKVMRVGIIEGELIIRIGIDVMAWAANHMNEWTPYDDEIGDYIQSFKVSDPLEFAKDVGCAMQEEAEDGSTPLTEFFDKMFMAAMEDGSTGVEFCAKGTPSVWSEDAKSAPPSTTEKGERG